VRRRVPPPHSDDTESSCSCLCYDALSVTYYYVTSNKTVILNGLGKVCKKSVVAYFISFYEVL
jgi:hypothetical protein